jgi:hypothetical protein
MRSIVSLAIAALLTVGVSACSYEEHHEYARAGYYNNDYGYYPEKHYYSQGDYYRHYNGIDG